MNSNQLTTVFYKYNRFAPVIIILYVLVFVVFFFISRDLPGYVSLIGFAVLILPPIIGAIRKKSFFNLRSWDERKLTLTPTAIQVGDQQFAVAELKIALHIHGFEGFSYSKNNKWITRNSIYGDQNYLSFKLGKQVEDYQFFLRDYNAYEALCNVAAAWKSSGVILVVKEQFKREFVRDQMQRFVGTKNLPKSE